MRIDRAATDDITASLPKPASVRPKWRGYLHLFDKSVYTSTKSLTLLVLHEIMILSSGRPREIAWAAESITDFTKAFLINNE